MNDCAAQPHFIATVLAEIKDVLVSSKLVVSIAAGISCAQIEEVSLTGLVLQKHQRDSFPT